MEFWQFNMAATRDINLNKMIKSLRLKFRYQAPHTKPPLPISILFLAIRMKFKKVLKTSNTLLLGTTSFFSEMTISIAKKTHPWN